MTPRPIARILEQARNKKIIVWGDLMLDQFIWGRVDRISPEAPVPVVRTQGETFHLGGAGNVAGNIASLGGVAWPLGVVGRDAPASHLLRALEAQGIDAGGVIQVDGRVTTMKTRIVAHSQQVVRCDREQEEPVVGKVAERLADIGEKLCREADAFVVSDYEKGCVTPALLEILLQAARRRDVPVIVDPKPEHWEAYTPITAIAPNIQEASRMVGIRIRLPEDLLAAGREIQRRLSCRGVLLTRGEKGMLLLEEGRSPVDIEATSREVFDVTGAGDTVVAALSLVLAAGGELRDAAEVANAAAGIVVGKVGTSVASPEEILAVI
ncbi:MAG: D-glycero-beta-D-manno-heptose-7-phosphate kinase [Acidobacteriota bacterium]